MPNAPAYDMRKPEDVELYLHNLKIEYQFGCLHEKNPEVCHLLGDYREQIEKDFKGAREIYQMNCEQYDFPRSCYKIGYYTLLGKGFVQEDPIKAFSYFEKGCSMNEASACFNAGMMKLAKGLPNSVENNPAEGITFWEKSCELKHAKACYFLGLGFYRGTNVGIPKDLKKALYFNKKSCYLQNQYACYNASQIYKTGGDGVEPNEELAEKFRQKGKYIDDYIQRGSQLTFQEGLSPV